MKKEAVQPDLSVSLIRAEPQLFVTRLPETCQFFEEVLGFTTNFVYGEPPFYAQVARDNAALNLRLVSKPMLPSDGEEDCLSASIIVRDLKSLFLSFQAAGAEFQRTLHTEPWGARTFMVRCPEGHLLLFAE